ncbi:MAG: phytochelatin synthase family protein, partial [Sphaerospermopsis kisseleviana]
MEIRFITSIKTSIKFLIFGICLTSSNVFAQTLPLTSNLIGFDTPEGQKLLISSQAKNDFFPLSTQFVTQNN